MPRSPAQTVHAVCAALFLVVAMPVLAQQKPASLIGVSREQAITRLGEPKSNIKAGSREVLFFTRLRLTLKSGFVIESEELLDEPAPKRAIEPAPSAPAAAPNSGQLVAPQPQSGGPAPTNPAYNNQSTAKPGSDKTVVAAKPSASTAPPALEIKFIKSSSARSSPLPAAMEPATNPRPAAEFTPEAGSLPTSAPVATGVMPVTNARAVETKPAAPTQRAAESPDTQHPTVIEEISRVSVDPIKPAVDPKKKAAVRQRWRLRRDAETEEDPVQLFSTQSYLIATVALVIGGGYLWWRRQQRLLALAASSVSQAPFDAPMAVDTAGQFTAEQVSKLDPKRFERLVASYYAKTGVVAERTNLGPAAPVHIKIFWKGEPKPFAGVQCHANPPALIGSQPLQALFASLSAEDIRRGYVVTNGKFNVEARDYAEEKHFTLLSGDIFIEKLNALPPAARGDLLKETSIEEPAMPAASGTMT